MMEFKALRVPTLTKEVATRLEARLIDLPGIKQFTITLDTPALDIVFDEEQLDFRILIQELAKAGCPLQSISAVLLK